jgi:UDP-N-acetylmuramoyl-L-alanyl-D-glutamate--2,6-diaminopimelate ligase
MERVMCGQQFAVLVDAADSPDALRVCLRAARRTTSGRILCVFGSNEDCDQNTLPAIGRVIGALSHAAAITNNPPHDGSHRACMEIRSGFADPRKARIIVDRTEAICWALREARAGDCIVIAGMGERPHSPADATGHLANDTQIVRQMLHGNWTNSLQRPLAA